MVVCLSLGSVVGGGGGCESKYFTFSYLRLFVKFCEIQEFFMLFTLHVHKFQVFWKSNSLSIPPWSMIIYIQILWKSVVFRVHWLRGLFTLFYKCAWHSYSSLLTSIYLIWIQHAFQQFWLIFWTIIVFWKENESTTKILFKSVLDVITLTFYMEREKFHSVHRTIVLVLLLFEKAPKNHGLIYVK